MWDVLERTHTAIARSHKIKTRVEVWRGDEQLADDAKIIDGSVADARVTGIRRSLSMSVPPDKHWRDWLKIGVEIRPFKGVDFGGPGVTEMCPMGRFPVTAFSSSSSVQSAIPIAAADRWSTIQAATFGSPRKALYGTVRDVVAYLIAEVDPYGFAVRNTATSTALTPAVVWDKTRHETIISLLTAIGAEAFFGRDGQPVIQDRLGIGPARTTIRTGRDGTAISLVESVDYAKVFNAVGVYSTNTAVVLDPVIVAISDPLDPAARERVSGGAKSGGWRSTTFSSAVFMTREEMLTAAKALLAKSSAPAKQWSISAIPDPSLDAGDTIWVETTPGGALELAQIQTITHPLTATAAQAITTVNTRAGDDDG